MPMYRYNNNLMTEATFQITLRVERNPQLPLQVQDFAREYVRLDSQCIIIHLRRNDMD